MPVYSLCHLTKYFLLSEPNKINYAGQEWLKLGIICYALNLGHINAMNLMSLQSGRGWQTGGEILVEESTMD